MGEPLQMRDRKIKQGAVRMRLGLREEARDLRSSWACRDAIYNRIQTACPGGSSIDELSGGPRLTDIRGKPAQTSLRLIYS